MVGMPLSKEFGIDNEPNRKTFRMFYYINLYMQSFLFDGN